MTLFLNLQEKTLQEYGKSGTIKKIGNPNQKLEK
jgi:hypothetical protein